MKKLIKLSDQIIIDNGELPLVTIFNWAFNHKDYIRESIDSILMQKTNFKVEIIIHDDSSTDGTKEIIIEYQQKYPHLFNNILQVENQWSQGKSVMVPLFEKTRGKYIALTHGDDYWSDPLKLQKQVNFLDSNPDYTICFTDYFFLESNDESLKESSLTKILNDRDIFYLNDIIKQNFIATLTVVYKKPLYEIPVSFYNLFPGDWPLHILNARNGKIKFLPFVSGVYRKHNNGVCSSSSPIKNYKKYLKSLKIIQGWFKDEDYATKFAFFIARFKIYMGILKHLLK